MNTSLSDQTWYLEAYMTVEKSIKWLGLVSILAGIARMGMTPAGLIYGGDSKQELTFALIASILMGIVQ
jgi:hypothetical protein